MEIRILIYFTIAHTTKLSILHCLYELRRPLILTVLPSADSLAYNNTVKDHDWWMSAMVTFERLVGVRGQPDSQAETDSRGAACDQHHLLVHGVWVTDDLLQWRAAGEGRIR